MLNTFIAWYEKQKYNFGIIVHVLHSVTILKLYGMSIIRLNCQILNIYCKKKIRLEYQ